MTEQSTEIEQVSLNITGLTFAEAVAAASEQGGLVTVEATETDKSTLIGVPLLVTAVVFKESDHGSEGDEYVVLRGISDHGAAFIISDGGTGIYQQVRELANKRPGMNNLLVKGGLRKSDYTYTNEAGKSAPATTYYLDMV